MVNERVAQLQEQLDSYPVALELDQVASILQVSRKTLDRIIQRGSLKAFTVDPTLERKQYRVLKADLIAYMIHN